MANDKFLYHITPTSHYNLSMTILVSQLFSAKLALGVGSRNEACAAWELVFTTARLIGCSVIRELMRTATASFHLKISLDKRKAGGGGNDHFGILSISTTKPYPPLTPSQLLGQMKTKRLRRNLETKLGWYLGFQRLALGCLPHRTGTRGRQKS